MSQQNVLIISDDTEFARLLAARWQAERQVPVLTLISSDLWRGANSDGYELVIVGPIRVGASEAILDSLDSFSAVCVAGDESALPALRSRFPHLLVIPRQEGWISTLIQVSNQALRIIENQARATRAERLAAECRTDSTLGRYMLDMRPSVNNALTTVLGNAELLLLEPGQLSAQSREQIATIHTMALRLNEIMQRFSSLASELQVAEKESHTETEESSHTLAESN